MNASDYAADFLRFADDIHLPVGGGVRRFGDAMAPFQRRDFEAMAPSLHALAAGRTAEVRRFWIERTKGGSKDSDLAVAMLWLLAFTGKPLRIQVGAYDQSQADELRLIVKQLLGIEAPLNQLLASVVEVQTSRIVAHRGTSRPESEVAIVTTDRFGTHGARPDVVILDELSHVTNQEFAETLVDNCDKLPHSLTLVCTNAGFSNLWQYQWREIARESDRWQFSVLREPAPWVDRADLAESKRRNPPARYRRLCEGVWASGLGNAVDPEDILAACVLDGPAESAESGFGYVAALDLGLKNDHSALICIAVDAQRRRYKLVDCQSWSPLVAGGTVRLGDVKAAVIEVNARFRPWLVVYDVWQAQLMAQQLIELGVPMAEVAFVPKKLDRMATSLVGAFRNRQIEMYRDPLLLRDLGKLTIIERQKGFKLEATRDETGHADRATALAMALPCAEDYCRESRNRTLQAPYPEIVDVY